MMKEIRTNGANRNDSGNETNEFQSKLRRERKTWTGRNGREERQANAKNKIEKNRKTKVIGGGMV